MITDTSTRVFTDNGFGVFGFAYDAKTGLPNIEVSSYDHPDVVVKGFEVGFIDGSSICLGADETLELFVNMRHEKTTIWSEVVPVAEIGERLSRGDERFRTAGACVLNSPGRVSFAGMGDAIGDCFGLTPDELDFLYNTDRLGMLVGDLDSPVIPEVFVNAQWEEKCDCVRKLLTHIGGEGVINKEFGTIRYHLLCPTLESVAGVKQLFKSCGCTVFAGSDEHVLVVVSTFDFLRNIPLRGKTKNVWRTKMLLDVTSVTEAVFPGRVFEAVNKPGRHTVLLGDDLNALAVCL